MSDLSEKRKEAQKEVLRKIHWYFKNIYKPEEEELPPSSTDDPLYEAALILCLHSGISPDRVKLSENFRKLREKNASPEEILRRIAFDSGFNIRKVELTPGWEKENCGSMISFDGKGMPVLFIHKRQGYSFLNHRREEYTFPVTSTGQKGYPRYAWTFFNTLPDEKTSLFSIIRYLLNYGVIKTFIIVVVFGLISGLLNILFPMLSGYLYLYIVPQDDYNQLFLIGLLLLTTMITSSLFSISQGLIVSNFESILNTFLQSAIWSKLLRFDINFFYKHSTGDLSVRVNCINSIRRIMAGTLLTTVFTFIFSFLNFILLFYYMATLAVVVAIAAFLHLLFLFLIGYKEFKYKKALNDISGRLSTLIFQIFNNISDIRLRNAEIRFYGRLVEIFTQSCRTDFAITYLNRLTNAFNTGFPPFLTAIVFFGFINFAGNGRSVSLPDFIAFNAAFMSFYASIRAFSDIYNSILDIVPLYTRALPILEEIPESSSGKNESYELRGLVEFQNVSFSYIQGLPVLKDVSIRADEGEFIAIVGKSGQGKSTILKLLLGFLKPEYGYISYDGHNIEDMNPQSLRKQMGVVLQNGQVTMGTIFYTITGASNMSVDDVWAAARMTHLEEDIKQMPMGLFTMVGDNGNLLSGGQKQRLLLARAIAHNPKILLLDEATSALDNPTQEVVMKNLENMKITRIVIAHRLSTIMNADRIYVLDGGTIVESGNYKELMDKGGLFASFASRQIS